MKSSSFVTSGPAAGMRITPAGKVVSATTSPSKALNISPTNAANDRDRVTTLLEQQGFEIIPAVITEEHRAAIAAHAGAALDGVVGSRQLLEHGWCAALAEHIRRHPLLVPVLGSCLRAVQCTYFDKSRLSNWLVAYHQDLSIPVAARVGSPACSAWAVKEGVTYVQPPFPVLESLIAVRLHLDDCREGNGPLRVLAGTHVHGRVRSSELPRMRELHSEITCLASAGDVLAFKPLLLHASSKATTSTSRRVLHFLYGPDRLPEGLEWRAAAGKRRGAAAGPRKSTS